MELQRREDHFHPLNALVHAKALRDDARVGEEETDQHQLDRARGGGVLHRLVLMVVLVVLQACA